MQITIIDQMPSVKAYRQFIVGSSYTKVLAAMMAVAASLDQFPSTSKEIIYARIVYLVEIFKREAAFIPVCMTYNMLAFQLGYMSRIIGILQSCPISNMSQLGLDPKSVNNLGVEQIIKLLQFGIALEIKAVLLTDMSGNGKVIQFDIQFDEPKFATERKLNGNTWVEHTTFGEDGLVRLQPIDIKLSVGFGGIVRSGSITPEIIAGNLSSIELLQYNAAKKNQNQDMLRSLSEQEKNRHEAKVNGSLVGVKESSSSSRQNLVEVVKSLAKPKYATYTKPALVAKLGELRNDLALEPKVTKMVLIEVINFVTDNPKCTL